MNHNHHAAHRKTITTMTHQELMKALKVLKTEPIEEFWTPKNIGVCMAQRIEANQLGCAMYLISEDDGLQDLYCYGIGSMYLQVGRVPNTTWYEESGYTYMLWN